MNQKQKFIDFLSSNHTMSLATSVKDRVHAASLFYVNQGFSIYFLSDPETQHLKQARENSAVALTIHESSLDFTQIKGLQIKGELSKVDQIKEKKDCLGLFVKRFPFMGKFLVDSSLQKHVHQAEIYKIRPTHITLIDNSLGFGHKESLSNFIFS